MWQRGGWYQGGRGIVERQCTRRERERVTWHSLVLHVPPWRVFGVLTVVTLIMRFSTPACQSWAIYVFLPPLWRSSSECNCISASPQSLASGDRGTTKPAAQTASCHSHLTSTLGELRPVIFLSNITAIWFFILGRENQQYIVVVEK